MTEAVSLKTLAAQQIDLARESSAGRSAHKMYGGTGYALRQTLLALIGGHSLGEHESPGEATLQVLAGRVRLHAGEDSWEAATGDYLTIPPTRHDLIAIEDSAFLLTVVIQTQK